MDGRHLLLLLRSRREPHRVVVQKRPMSIFTTNEIEYLGSSLLGRLATVGQDGIPHVAPVGMISYYQHLDTMVIRGHYLTNTKKFRDIAFGCCPRRGRSRPQSRAPLVIVVAGVPGPSSCLSLCPHSPQRIVAGARHQRVRTQQPSVAVDPAEAAPSSASSHSQC